MSGVGGGGGGGGRGRPLLLLLHGTVRALCAVVTMSSSYNESDVEGRLNGLSCTTYFDSLVFCTTPTNQITSYYRFGKLDDCKDAIDGLKTCMRIKVAKISDKEKARRLMKASSLKVSPTIGTVRDPRETPTIASDNFEDSSA